MYVWNNVGSKASILIYLCILDLLEWLLIESYHCRVTEIALSLQRIARCSRIIRGEFDMDTTAIFGADAGFDHTYQ